MTGAEHNDEFSEENDDNTTKTNNSGGIQGGISMVKKYILKLLLSQLQLL